jgi:hypothetical protein
MFDRISTAFAHHLPGHPAAGVFTPIRVPRKRCSGYGGLCLQAVRQVRSADESAHEFAINGPPAGATYLRVQAVSDCHFRRDFILTSGEMQWH